MSYCRCKTCNHVLEKAQKLWGDSYAQHGLGLHVGRGGCAKSLKSCVFSLFSCAMWTASFSFVYETWQLDLGNHFGERDLGSLMQSSVSLAGIKVGETRAVISTMLVKSTVMAFQKYLCSYFISLWLEPSLNKS